MKKQDYNATIVVKATPAEAFKNVNRVSAWWTENLEGSSENLNDVFTVHFGDTFVTFKIIELVPAKKVVWLVTDCYLHWLNDKTEWNNTRISAEVTSENDATTVSFTHVGLVPGIECYDMCIKGWDQYVKTSLYKLITEGKGMPEKKVPATATAAH